MSKSINTKQKELSTTQENAENNHNKNSNLIEREKIENTPFTLIKRKYEDDSTIWFIVMGDYRLTEPTETKEEQIEKLEKEKWLLIIDLIVIAQEKMKDKSIKDLI